MLAKVICCALVGLDGVLVEVEVNISRGLPSLTVVGLPDAAVEGIVTDANSSAPLDGAVVSTNLGGFEATTDPDGFYYLEVASGSQTVTLGHEVVGYPRKVYRAEQNVNPYVGDTIQLDLNLTPTVFDNLIFLPLVQRGG